MIDAQSFAFLLKHKKDCSISFLSLILAFAHKHQCIMSKSTACDTLKTSQVYCQTTLPTSSDSNNGLDNSNKTAKAKSPTSPTAKPKKVRRDKSDLGENFKAPDGGWAWLVCIAAGCSNVSACTLSFSYWWLLKLKFIL